MVGAERGAEDANVGSEHSGKRGEPAQRETVRLVRQSVPEADKDKGVADAI